LQNKIYDACGSVYIYTHYVYIHTNTYKYVYAHSHTFVKIYGISTYRRL